MVFNRKNFYLLRLCLAIFIFALTIAAFASPSPIFHKIIALQLGPQLIKLFIDFSIPAAIVIFLLLLFTFLFGRFYCSIICPFGLLQDFIGFVFKRKTGKSQNFYKTRYFITLVVLGLLIGGFVIGLKILDPFSNFGLILSAVLNKLSILSFVHVLLVLVIITILVFFKNRIFCTTICPIGTILGICSKYGIFRLNTNRNCTKCKQCEKECPTGCIDLGIVDNERCVRCLKCINKCQLEAIKYGK